MNLGTSETCQYVRNQLLAAEIAAGADFFMVDLVDDPKAESKVRSAAIPVNFNRGFILEREKIDGGERTYTLYFYDKKKEMPFDSSDSRIFIHNKFEEKPANNHSSWCQLLS